LHLIGDKIQHSKVTFNRQKVPMQSKQQAVHVHKVSIANYG